MFRNDFGAMSLASALKWSFLSELAAKIVAPLVFVILARLLAPEDFGVVAAATMVVAFSQIFWEAGMGKALIQYQGDGAAAADAAFWVNGVLAIAIAMALIVAADGVAERIFHDQRVTLVLQVMSLQVVLSAAVSVHTALLQKDMKFKPLFWVRLATVAVPGLISIPLAVYGMGYWALIAGTLIGQAAQVIMLWRMSQWRPRCSFDVQIAREIGRFGAWVAVSGLLAWFYVWADSLIVGMYLGSHELGLYRTGNQFAMMIFAILFGPIVPVLYSHLSTMKQDRERLKNAIEKVIKVLTLIAIPLAFIVFSLAEPIAAALFGEPWQGISLVIGVMALSHGFSWVAGMNGEVFRAMGKPSYETVVAGTALAIYLGAYLISIRQGFEVFVWTRFALALSGLALHLFFLRKVVPVRLAPIARYLLTISMMSAAVVVFVRFLSSAVGGGAWWHLMVGGALNIILLGTAIVLIDRKGILKEAAEIVRSGTR
ncbi:MAG: lipopolysaccharide biosynthesis protein [Sulfuritalea sp.]|nr:lipopolysaccharide biosynthesis protein [Sulfuritalea sp.]